MKTENMKREKEIEHALEWAYRMGYSTAASALHEYCENRGLIWSTDYQGIISFETLTDALAN